MTKLLLIIDMQEDFFQQGRLAEKRAEITNSLNELVVAFREENQTIIWVRQVFKADLSDTYLALRKSTQQWTIEGTSGCTLLSELIPQPEEHEIIKKRYSAFFRTELDEVLANIAPSEIVIAGVNTHACIRVTAIDAYQRDYQLVLAKECIDSYDQGCHDESFSYLVNSGIGLPLANNQIIERLKANKSLNRDS
ncbi:cysteine hydrolase family protein [Vibrio parahaemolyticus]|uniref:cysteine hydrolase family protein n=1 Tax=Vibrio parahaemolyticus TaxID=670 RepID=UPI0004A262A6|nr:cysteine hydrolase [Vibrio parahaemolyticus]EGQ8305323.1 isochorismatase family protein [Vibrio parahaemolyticus]EGR2933845.1 cysteine hydrolase [Vibrio parahaemolyticus]EGR3275125.1 cysteine hydrolase [Vibrio parahaemolyticus]EGR3308399.1 cysteine hydrolase [Vibrio parahaemolyticus]EJG0163832.1 cysteine hydrolase [Vibrio parahaemolyticus]